ncbi:MAG: enoyl-CoA hydratase [Chloroflexota bacterium]|jgi:enoyl-CoA hydratase|nr:enoyl-CoA hydratase [Chloroflexota bacterium]
MTGSRGVTTIERHGDVAVLRLDRPPVNAMDLATLRELIAALDVVAADPPRALVLAGREGAFSAGLDLKVVPTLDAAGQREMVEGVNGLFLAAYGLPFPVVAAVAGHAIAGGFIFALCADRRVAATTGSHGVTELRVGVPFPAVAIGVVRAELSPQVARVLALGAGLVDPTWCLHHGIYDEVVEAPAVLGRAMEIAAQLAQMPAAAYARAKQDLRGDTLVRLREAAMRDPLLDAWVDDESRRVAGGALDQPAP